MVTEYVFKLYVAGGTANARRAQQAIQRLCDQLRADADCVIEVVDVLEHPDRAVSESIIATPTLQRLAPHPPSRVVGDMTDTARVMLGLGISGRT